MMGGRAAALAAARKDDSHNNSKVDQEQMEDTGSPQKDDLDQMKEFKPHDEHQGPSEEVLAKEAAEAERVAAAGEYDPFAEIAKAKEEMERQEIEY